MFGEAAFKLSQARYKLMSLQDKIFIHLFKYFYYPNNQSVNKWKKELEGWRKTLVRYGLIPGSSASNYSLEELMDAFFESPFGTKEDAELIIEQLIDDEYPELGIEEVLASKEAFKGFVQSYCDAIVDKRKYPRY